MKRVVPYLVSLASLFACAGDPARPPTTPSVVAIPSASASSGPKAPPPAQTATASAPSGEGVPVDWRRCASFAAFTSKKEMAPESRERLHGERELFDCSSPPSIRLVSPLPLEALYALVASCPVQGEKRPHVIHNDHDVFFIATTHVREEGMAIVTRLAQNPKIHRVDVVCSSGRPQPN